MIKIALVREIVSVLRQVGPTADGELLTHLPDCSEPEFEQALVFAQQQGWISESNRCYECLVPGAQWVDPQPDVQDIVAHALRVRSPLELAWACE